MPRTKRKMDPAKKAARDERKRIEKERQDRIDEAYKRFPKQLLDSVLFSEATTQSDVIEATNLFKRALMERVLNAEMSHELGYDRGATKPAEAVNARNGHSDKTIQTETGAIKIKVPRDRKGSFEPLMIPKHSRRFTGFDDKILALYARGMTVREIQAYLREMYVTEVSAELISEVTDAVLAEVGAWQNRPLEPMYPVVFFDAMRVKITHEGVVQNKAVHLALGILPDGTRDILGVWVEVTEGAKFWMRVFSELKSRGCQDILIAVTDGLMGLSEALESIFPDTVHRTCIVHLIRNSLAFASWKTRKALAAELRPIYTAANSQAAEAALEAFAASPMGLKHPSVAPMWRRAWPQVIPFFAFEPDIRKIIYTTNAIESVHARLRKIIKSRGHFPTDDAAIKLIWLALRNITTDWSRSARDWKAAMSQFALLYPERFNLTR